jgi:hypothetical protein
MSLAKNISQQLLANLSQETNDPNTSLNNSLRLLSKWRSVLIQNTLIEQEGTKVLQGPLAGMEFIERSAEGCHIAKLLGCYEQPLQPHIQKALSGHYTKIINIGCAEGYYAVGFARAVPGLISLAFDTDTNAQNSCRQLSEKNGVSDRVTIGGLFSPDDFAKFENEAALVFCDIEGAEEELLDPDVAPALRKLDIIVESHECLRPGITQKLLSRFEATHTIELIEDNGSRQLDNPPAWFTKLSHLDQLLATWEWRSGQLLGLLCGLSLSSFILGI